MEEAGGGDIMRNKLPGNVFREGHSGKFRVKAFFNKPVDMKQLKLALETILRKEAVSQEKAI